MGLINNLEKVNGATVDTSLLFQKSGELVRAYRDFLEQSGIDQATIEYSASHLSRRIASNTNEPLILGLMTICIEVGIPPEQIGIKRKAPQKLKGLTSRKMATPFPDMTNPDLEV